MEFFRFAMCIMDSLSFYDAGFFWRFIFPAVIDSFDLITYIRYNFLLFGNLIYFLTLIVFRFQYLN